MKCSFCEKDKSPLFDSKMTFKGTDGISQPHFVCIDCIDFEMPYLKSFTEDPAILDKHQKRISDFILKNK